MKRPYSLLLLCVFLAVCLSANGQNPNIRISTKNAPNEISIAINPTDHSKILAAANIASVYTSGNGGLTWKQQTQRSKYGVWGDPVVAIDHLGNYFHFHLSSPESGHWLDRIVCQKSLNQGATFNQGSFTGLTRSKQQDKHWVAIDPKSQTMVLTWTQFDEYESKDPDDHSNILFSKSGDHGDSWSEPVQINAIPGDCLDNDNTVEGAVPAVGPQGEIYVAWAGPAGLVFNKSTDGGDTWLDREVKIDSIAGGWTLQIPGIYRANGMPVTKCDRSDSPNRGTIYVNWVDKRYGDKDVFLTRSSDGGQTWTKAVKVNQDKSGHDQFFTWMDIDQSNGNLYFVYHDRRNHAGDSTDVYLSYSTDGGRSFKDLKISASPFLPDSSVFFGDYNTIAAHNGVVRPAWTRLDEKELSVWTAIVETQTLLDPQNKKLEAAYKNGKLNLSFAGKFKGEITILDLNRNTIETAENQKIEKTGFQFDPINHLPVGVYSVRIRNDKMEFERQFLVKDQSD